MTRARPPRRDVLPRVQRLRRHIHPAELPASYPRPIGALTINRGRRPCGAPDPNSPSAEPTDPRGERGSPIVGGDQRFGRAVLAETADRGCSRVPVGVRTNGNDRPPCPRGTPHVLRAPVQAISPFVPSGPWVGYSPRRVAWGAHGPCGPRKAPRAGCALPQRLPSGPDATQPRPSPGPSLHATRVIPIASSRHRRTRLRRGRESRHPAPIDGTRDAEHPRMPR